MFTLETTVTVSDLLHNAGSEYGDQTFLRYMEKERMVEKSYEEFVTDCDAIAAWAESKKEAAGHTLHVALLGTSSYYYLTVLLGVMSDGQVAVPLDRQVSEEQLEDELKRADVEYVFYDWEHRLVIDKMKQCCKRVKQFICLQTEHSVHSAEKIISHYKHQSVHPLVLPEDLAIIIFTSGTTGRGKGVMLSHANLIDNTFCTSNEDISTEDIYLNVLPIHHVYCLNGDVLLTLRYGSILCLCKEVSKLQESIQLFQPTVIRMVPLMIKALYKKIAMKAKQHPELPLEQIKDSVLGSNLRKVISGGGYLTEKLAAKYQKMGIMIGQGYGMSECSPKISAPDFDRPDKISSVGRVVDGCEVRVIDNEIQVRSKSVMMGYYKEPEKTAEVITEDGWLCTGDIGYVDEEGFLYLTGRKKNLIILSNGENVAPEELENLFENELMISDILVYGDGETIAAEVYPNYNYIEAENIENVEENVRGIINTYNQKLPSYKRIVKCKVRNKPFEKTSSKKIIRYKYFGGGKVKKSQEELLRLPVNQVQASIYDCVAESLGNRKFSIDSDLYECGLDSFGSIMLIEELHNKFKKSITVEDLLEHNSVLKLESYFEMEGQREEKTYQVQEIYPLTSVQIYFAYVLMGNTTSNLPFLFQLDSKVDLLRLQNALEKTIDAHPGLKGIFKKQEGKYILCRHDDAKPEVPIRTVSKEEWKGIREGLLRIFTFTEDDPLYRASIYQVEDESYLFMDVSHAMGDGMSMNIIFEDMNTIYNGGQVEPEQYSVYEYILDEMDRNDRGLKVKNEQYYSELMKDLKINRSILNKREKEDLSVGRNAMIKCRFEDLTRKEVLEFCKRNHVSENVLFITAFNQTICLFSDEKEAISTSVHSGRTDNRWTRIVGPLFRTYFFRYQSAISNSIPKLLKTSGKQIMNTMKCYIPTIHANEMFFQYQGDILNIDQIGNEKAKLATMNLDSLPFHLQVMSDEDGYRMQLRYWENRFDETLVHIFIECYKGVLNAFLQEQELEHVNDYIPKNLYPESFSTAEDFISHGSNGDVLKAYVLDEDCNKKPIGAWGTVFVMDVKPKNCMRKIKNPFGEGMLYQTDRIARVLPDGMLDFLEQSGKVILLEDIKGIHYADAALIESICRSYQGVISAYSYTCYGENSQMAVAVDLVVEQGITLDKVMEYLNINCPKIMMPSIIRIVEK